MMHLRLALQTDEETLVLQCEPPRDAKKAKHEENAPTRIITIVGGTDIKPPTALESASVGLRPKERPNMQQWVQRSASNWRIAICDATPCTCAL